MQMLAPCKSLHHAHCKNTGLKSDKQHTGWIAYAWYAEVVCQPAALTESGVWVSLARALAFVETY